MKIAHVLMIVALFALIMPAVAAAPLQPNEEDVRVYIIGPSVVGMGQVAEYEIIITGGPAEAGGEWTYSSEIRGVNLTATSLNPTTDNSTYSGFFSGSLLAPDEVQEISLVIRGTSEMNGIKDTGEATKTIKIIKPYILTATVSNEGSVAVEGLDVRFYVDGKLLKEETIPNLGAEEMKVVTANWTVEDVEPGRHVAKIEIDTEDTGVILLESGSKIYLREFYIEEEESSVPWVFSIIILIGAVAGSLFLLRKSGYV